ncbi:MAG: T9SS type A sorting domain-containing protein [Bacteroidetes bacterium]|nr:T9SS type A sorting domain-containing protein [Bacteroidota bacterium]
MGASNNSISHFTYGVYATNLNTHDLAEAISFTNFNHNKVGIYLTTGTLHTITKTNVTTTNSSYKWNDKTTTNKPSYLAQLSNCNNIALYDCDFKSDFDGLDYVVLNTTGTSVSQLESCLFKNTGAGNRSTGLLNQGNCSGFFFTCNTFEDMDVDWEIASGAEVEYSQAWGMDNGNVHTTSTVTYHIDNNSSYPIRYNQASASTLTTDGIVHKTNKSGFTCIDRFGDGSSACDDHPTGIKQVFTNHTFELFPNPATDRITFMMNNDEVAGTIEVLLYSMDGQIVANEILPARNLEYDTSNLPIGVYQIICINATGNTYHAKFVKQ